jgi:hypothetical protein
VTCTNGLLESISNNYLSDDSASTTKLTSGDDNGNVGCDWTGPGRINGIYDCDDFNFECYDGVLYGIKTLETQSDCPSIDYSPFGSDLDGVVCNFATGLRTSGLNYVDFSFDCQNGTVDYIYFDQGAAKMMMDRGSSKQSSSDAPTCTTWATASGVRKTT